MTLLAACSSLISHITDEKTNKAGSKSQYREIESFKGLRHVLVRLTWTTSLLFKQSKDASWGSNCILSVTEKRKKSFTVRLNAEFGLISCGLMVTIAPGQIIQPDRLAVITQIMLGESFCF